MSRSHLEVKGQNEYCLIGLYLVRLTFQPCIIGFQTMMRPRPEPQMSRSHLEVKGQNEYCLIGLYLVRPSSNMGHAGLKTLVHQAKLKILLYPKKTVLGGYIGVTVSVGRKPYFVRPISYKPLEFNTNLHEASIPRGNVHIIKGLQLHDILQSYGSFTY